MTSREFAETLAGCIACVTTLGGVYAENWNRAAWSTFAGNLKVEKIQETLLADGSTSIKMMVRIHTAFVEGLDEDGEPCFFPSETDRFTVRMAKQGTVKVPMEGFGDA